MKDITLRQYEVLEFMIKHLLERHRLATDGTPFKLIAPRQTTGAKHETTSP